MSVSPGARLGPYEIVAPLGAGGMGEVYKARDIRLDRIVAIKILPADVARDERRRERFRREARAISSLTHPHICTLYDVGEQDGIDYLVMEYLTGETLAQRLVRGPLPLDDVLRTGAQIADALDAAHRQGVIHRDLKPANVMLTASGAKILDFGLAKWQGTGSDAALSIAATAHPTLTQSGTIAGTVDYMAPEQVEGKPTDARSDLFALGAILYEMTTARKAFEGTSPASVMSAILNAAPPAMSTVTSATPPALEHVVKTCLSKNPDMRWQNAGDVARQLNWIGDTPSVVPSPTRRRGRAEYYAIGAVLLAALGAIVALTRRGQPPLTPQVARLFLPPPENATLPTFNGFESPPIVSPDGRLVAFVASEIGRPASVWIRGLDAQTARRLAGTDGVGNPAFRPFWSSDSRSLGFFAEGKLKRIDVDGGAPQVLADAPDPRGGTWNNQNIIVFAPNSTGPLYRIPANGGLAVAVTTLRSDRESHRWPAFLPDNRHFLFLDRVFTGPREQSGTYAASLDSREDKRVLPIDTTYTNVVCARSGDLLFARDGTLFAQRYDPATFTIAGTPAIVADHVVVDGGMGAAFSISDTGVLVYREAPAPPQTQLSWFDRGGARLSIVGPAVSQDAPALSPDGTRIAVRRNLATPGREDIWVVKAATGVATRLTFDSGNFAPIWSPDSRWVAYGSQRPGPNGIINGVFRKLSDGVADTEAVVLGRYSVQPTGWSRDGKFIIYADQDSTTGADLWAVALDGDRRPVPLVRTMGADNFGQLSPDGRWLAYASDVTGRMEVYVRGFPNQRGTWQISTNGGTQPRWQADGKELFFVSGDNRLTSVAIVARENSVESGGEKPLFEYPGFSVDEKDYSYDVSPEGQRFLINASVTRAAQPIVVVLNWTASLRR